MASSLTYELIANEVVVQHHEADHGELGQRDLELKALVKDGVVAAMGDGPGAALHAVHWDPVDLHKHVGVHHVPFGPRAPGLGEVLTTDDLEGGRRYRRKEEEVERKELRFEIIVIQHIQHCNSIKKIYL